MGAVRPLGSASVRRTISAGDLRFIMALIVQKYGGTSVATVERIEQVARKVIAARARGDSVVVVVSAMSGETDRLLGLARQITTRPDTREVDVLISTGEQVTIALLAMTLQKLGCPARSYTGAQIPIVTDTALAKRVLRRSIPPGCRPIWRQGT